MMSGKSGEKCACCGHVKGWHEDLDGECSIGGCDCKGFAVAPGSERLAPGPDDSHQEPGARSQEPSALTHPDEIACLTCGHIRVLHESSGPEGVVVGKCGQSGCDCEEFDPAEDVEAADLHYREHKSSDPAVREKEREAEERAMARDHSHNPTIPGPKDEPRYE